MTNPSPVHMSTALYLESFDFAKFMSEPSRELMIAATPRSGSTAFCLEAWRTGILGAPLEYANFQLMNRIPRWTKKLQDKLDYWRTIRSLRTGQNGLFSYKFFVSNYAGIANSEPRLLQLIAPSRVIYLTRRDLLSQSISYSRAARTGKWFGSSLSENETMPLDSEHVKDRYLSLKRQMQRWETVFEMTGTDPFRVTYEEFLADPAQVMRNVVAYVLYPDAPVVPKSIPRMEIQRDSQTEKWRSVLSKVEGEWNALPFES